jgi:polyisoprenoid-binding protein YceI
MLQNRRFFAAAALALTLAIAPSALAQTDPSAAPAGTYVLDVNHTAVIARVPHQTFSYEIFRFTPTSGELTWDPANAAANRLSVTLNTATIQTPVEGFAEELQGRQFLNSAQFPQATFVSTAFRQIDATHAEVTGNFTLKGVAKPITFNVELIGAGRNPRGRNIIGVHARARIDNADYDFPSFIRGQSEIVVDAEFGKQ